MKSVLKRLEEKYPEALKQTFIDNIGGNIIYIWMTVTNVHGHNLSLSFSEKRQLFLELIEYFMREKLIMFAGRYFLPKDEVIPEKARIWDHSTSIEETIAYMDRYFPKTGDKYPFEQDKWNNEEYFKKHTEEEGRFTDFFYVYMPDIYYWHDESDTKYLSPCWVVEDDIS